MDFPGDGPQTLAVGVVDHRGQEPLEREVDGDAEVHAVVDDQLVVAHRGVDVREVLDGVDDGPRDERQIGEREALPLLPLALGRAAHPVDVLEVDLDCREDVRRRGLGAHHVLGRPPADVGEGDGLVVGAGLGHAYRRGGLLAPRLALLFAGRRSGRPLGLLRLLLGRPLPLAGVDDGEDVGSGDAAALARALDLGGVEVVLGDELAHHRRQHLAATAAVALRLGRRCLLALLALLALFGLRGRLRRLLLLGLFGLGLGPGGTGLLLLGRFVVL